MRRDQFLKSLAALAAAGALPLTGQAASGMKIMIPANPGGGWDSTGRALGKALQDSGAASSVVYDNKGGAAGAIGLAQFASASKGDPNALLVMGAVMLGGIITGKPPVGLDQVTFWNEIGMAFSFLGREICRPTNPKCDDCPINKHCNYFKNLNQ